MFVLLSSDFKAKPFTLLNEMLSPYYDNQWRNIGVFFDHNYSLGLKYAEYEETECDIINGIILDNKTFKYKKECILDPKRISVLKQTLLNVQSYLNRYIKVIPS